MHEIGTFGYAMVTSALTAKQRQTRAKVRKGLAKKPPLNPVDRTANAEIGAATDAVTAARSVRDRVAALAELRRCVQADEARLRHELLGWAFRVADNELKAARTHGLHGLNLSTMLTNAAHAIADVSNEDSLCNLVPTLDDLRALESGIREGWKGRRLVTFLAFRTGAFGQRARGAAEALGAVPDLLEKFKKTPRLP